MKVHIRLAALAAALCFSGCYWDRLTGNYDSVFDVTNTSDDSAVLDETGRDEESLARQRKRLEELAADEEPVYRMNAGDTIEIHEDAIDENDVVLLHDDLLATGGTMKAALNLVNKFHPKKTYMNFLIEIVNEGLNGREAFGDSIEITTLLEV